MSAYTVKVERRRRIPLDGGGFTTEHAGWATYHVAVQVDAAGLAQALGERAVRSKGKRATAVGGLVVVEVLGGEVQP
jgi:hypothetical protein